MLDPKLLFAAQNPKLLSHFVDITSEFESYFGELLRKPVNPRPSQQTIGSLLKLDFQQTAPLGQTIKKFVSEMGESLLHVDHPMYFGVFNPNPLFAGVVADVIVAQLNPQLASTASASYAIECEAKLVSWFAEKAGWPQSSGSFCSGGTEANLTAVLCALYRRFPSFFQSGLAGTQVKPCVYASVEAHHSFKKAVRILGMGAAALREVPVDENLRISMPHLISQIAEDKKNGFHPILVVGTLGTTSAGTVDPFDELAMLCRTEGMDFHVDAAWGGGALLLPEVRALLKGIESADSLTIDAHKWFAVPMTAGIFLSRHQGLLKAVFDIGKSPYMPPDSFENDKQEPFKESLLWSRRFMGLKLLFCLATIGESGYVELFRHSMKMAEKFRSLLESSAHWMIESESRLPVICFRPSHLKEAAEIESFAESVNITGKAWITTSRLGNMHQSVLRVGFPNFATAEEHVTQLMQVLEEQRKTFSGAKKS